MEQAEDRCQIYLIVPGDIDRTHLDALLASKAFSSVGCVLLRARDGEIDRDLARTLLTAAHQADIPLLLENDISAVTSIGADGVHIDGSEDGIARARDALGADRIVGTTCATSRHMAMTMSERGADYVAFSADDTDELGDFVEWWSDVTVVPCIGWNIRDMAVAEHLADSGADFLSFDTLVWSHPAGPAAALQEIADRLSADRSAA